MNLKKGFTLAEILIVVLIVGILTAIAVPRLSFSLISNLDAKVQSKRLAAVIRKTRSLAILHAATNNEGFRLSMTGPEPYAGYEIVDIDTSETVETGSIEGVECTGASVFNFGPLGNRLSPNTEGLEVADGEKSYGITVVNSTGMVRWAEE